MKKLICVYLLIVTLSGFTQFEPNGKSTLGLYNPIKNTIPKTLPIIKYKGEEKGIISFNGANITDKPKFDRIGSEIWVLKPINLKGKRKQVTAFTSPAHLLDKDFYRDRKYKEDAPFLLHEFLELEYLNRKKLVKEVFAISIQEDSQVASHLVFALSINPSYNGGVEYENIMYWLLDLNEAKESTQNYINDLAKIEEGKMGLNLFNNKYKTKNTMLNKKDYMDFLNQYLTSYEFENDFFPTHNDEFKMNLSESGLSMDSIKIELKDYENLISQLKNFDKSINDFYDKYFNKYISRKSYKDFKSYADREVSKIIDKGNFRVNGKFHLILTHKRHDNGIRYSYKNYVKHGDPSNQEKKSNVEISAYLSGLGNWEDAQYELLKLKPSFGTSLTFLDTLYELTTPGFYNTRIHGDSAISLEQFKDAKIDLNGNKLINSYVGKFNNYERFLALYEKDWVNGVVKSSGLSRNEDGTIAINLSFEPNKDSVELGISIYTFDINEAYSIYLENYNRTKERFAAERAYEAQEEERLKSEREKTKKSLYAKYGKKYVDAAYDFEFIVGMHEDLANIIVQQLWLVHSSDEMGDGSKRYWLKPNSSVGTKRVIITIKNKKITRVSSW